MEYVEGPTLRSLLREGPLPVKDALRYATEIAEGLGRAHECGLVHRDIKPENLILASEHVKILDFGLAKIVEKRDEAITETISGIETISGQSSVDGMIVGTPAYMSPEQARGDRVDSRSDVFSFGSTLYEMVTGTPPFHGHTHHDILASILRDEPTRPSDLNREVPFELDRIIRRCLKKQPEDRYSDTRDLLAEFRDLETEFSSRNSRMGTSDRAVQVQSIRIPTDSDVQKYDAKLQDLLHGIEAPMPRPQRRSWQSIRWVLPLVVGVVGLALFSTRAWHRNQETDIPIMQAYHLEAPGVSAESLESVAMMLARKEDFVDAKWVAERALEIRKRTMGPEDVGVAGSLAILATLSRETEDYNSAEQLYRRALAIWEKKSGPVLPERYAGTLLEYSVLLRRMGMIRQADSLRTRAEAIKARRDSLNLPP